MNRICLNCKMVYTAEPYKCNCGSGFFGPTEALPTPENVGTITWFKCSDQKPPVNETYSFFYSIAVLVTDGRHIEAAIYCYSPVIGNPYWHIHKITEPTHWAYINYPE